MLINIEQIIIVILFFLCTSKMKENLQSKVSNISRDVTDCLRGIAILFVVIHHVGNYSGSSIFTPFGGIGVAIFLILSGYGINESFQRKGLSDYWVNKVIRVVLPMLLVEVLGLIFFERDITFGEIVNHMLCIDRNWYIRYLFYWYLIYYLSARFWCNHIKEILLCSSVGMFLFLPEIEAEQSVSFVFGVLLSAYRKQVSLFIDSKKLFLFCVGTIICCSIFLATKQMPVIRNYQGAYIYTLIQLIVKISGALGGICCVLIVLRNFCVPYFLHFIGLMSYELYLVHCKLLFLVNEGQNEVNLILFYVLSFAMSYILYKFNGFSSKYLLSYFKK